MNRTEDISKLATALAVAQGQIESASKDATNPHFRSKYADFDSVREAVKKPLSSNGIAFLQLPRVVESGVEVETFLIHGESGQFVSEVLMVPLGQITPQAIGSAITYLRRYSLQTIVGVSAGEDDDGNAVEKVADKNYRPAAKPPAPTQQEKEKESFLLLHAMLEEIGAFKTKTDAAKWAMANEARKGYLFAEHYKTVSEAFRGRLAEFQEKKPPKPADDFIDFEKLRTMVMDALKSADDIDAKRSRFHALVDPHWADLMPPDQADLETILRRSEAESHGADEDGVIWSEDEPA